MARNDEDVPVNISKNRARGGVTGHHVRYVLAFGLAGIIGALATRYQLSSSPRSQETPATGQ